jgi:nucleotide-binding universal stress UspA family protein
MAKPATRSPGRSTVLVPLDGSAVGESALRDIERLGLAPETELLLLQVVAPVSPTRFVTRYGPTSRGLLEERLRRARAYLEGVQQRLRRRGVMARVRVRSGEPAREILACARAAGAALIALSTHGRTGLRRVLLGSVAEAVIRHARVPVLLVSRGARASRSRRSR